MKKIIIFLLSLCVVSLFILFQLKSSNEPQENNAFKRKFKNVILDLKNVKELKSRPFGFASQLDSSIMINVFSDQFNLYKLNYKLNKIDTLKLQFPSEFNTKVYRIHKDILNTSLYCMNAYGDLAILSGSNSVSYKAPGLQIDRLWAITPNTMIVRTIKLENKNKTKELSKLIVSDNIKVTKEYQFPKLLNSLFANDGILHYNRKNNYILYMYYYRGEFISLDTNLNLLYTSKTIDTVRTAQIKTRTIKTVQKGEQLIQTTPAGPPKFVNTYFTTKDEKIYILSKLKADNESLTNFNKKQVIDVYDIKSGTYLNSFYIPKYKGLKLRQFLVKENIIIALFGQYITTYDFKE